MSNNNNPWKTKRKVECIYIEVIKVIRNDRIIISGYAKKGYCISVLIFAIFFNQLNFNLAAINKGSTKDIISPINLKVP